MRKSLDPGLRRDDEFGAVRLYVGPLVHSVTPVMLLTRTPLLMSRPDQGLCLKNCCPLNRHPGEGWSGGFRPHAVCPRNGTGLQASARPARGDPVSFITHKQL